MEHITKDLEDLWTSGVLGLSVWLDNNSLSSLAPDSRFQKVQIQKCAASKVWKLTCPGKL